MTYWIVNKACQFSGYSLSLVIESLKISFSIIKTNMINNSTAVY